MSKPGEPNDRASSEEKYCAPIAGSPTRWSATILTRLAAALLEQPGAASGAEERAAAAEKNRQF